MITSPPCPDFMRRGGSAYMVPDETRPGRMRKLTKAERDIICDCARAGISPEDTKFLLSLLA